MTNLKILYIEDDNDDANLLREQFKRKQGGFCQIIHSPCFIDAINKIKKENFTAILLDLNLPDGQGLEGIEIIKSIKPDLPIVILTSENNEEKAEMALQKGAQEYIVKTHATCDIIQRILQSSILRQKVERDLFHKAHFDTLTDLPNRQSFEETAKMLIKRAKRWNRREALMFIDLNKFKIINDTHGHEVGNLVLKETAKRLKETLRQSDIIARYAGDEFVVYLDSHQNTPMNEELCQIIAEKIIKGTKKPLKINNLTLEISLSVGIAIFPDAGEDFDSLLKNADAAMYQAKNHDHKEYFILSRHSDHKINHSVENMSLEKIAGDNVDINQKTILIVDDDAADQALMGRMIREFSSKFHIHRAKNIRETRKILEHHSPDCILLDYNLQDMNGLEFLKNTQSMPNFKSVVIIVSDTEDVRLATQSLKLGAYDYLLKKEINRNSLERVINNAISNKKLSNEVEDYRIELEKANKELTDFSHIVAHDLKAPLRRIYTFCEILETQTEAITDDNTKHCIARLSISASRLQKLVDNLLVYAQVMRSHEIQAEMSLDDLAKEILDDLEPWLKERNAKIKIDPLPTLIIYPLRIRQLFLNLITNSIKYARPDIAPSLKISFKIEDGHCVISFKDNGMGMNKNKLNQIFNPFFRLHSNDVIEGTGLGLSICEKVMNKHKGRIWAESQEGKGSIFNIALPLSVPDFQTQDHHRQISA